LWEKQITFFVAVIVWKLDLQLPMQSVPITIDVVSSNLDQGRELCDLFRETIGHPFRIKVLFVCLVVFNATFNNIPVVSWRLVLLVEETGGLEENHRPGASH
jgi:hypothetical protein